MKREPQYLLVLDSSDVQHAVTIVVVTVKSGSVRGEIKRVRAEMAARGLWTTVIHPIAGRVLMKNLEGQSTISRVGGVSSAEAAELCRAGGAE